MNLKLRLLTTLAAAFGLCLALGSGSALGATVLFDSGPGGDQTSFVATTGATLLESFEAEPDAGLPELPTTYTTTNGLVLDMTGTSASNPKWRIQSGASLYGAPVPDGSKAFTSGVEPYGNDWGWDFYSYWQGMHVHGDGNYWGTPHLQGVDKPKVEKDKWVCVEMMIKLNSPTDAANGEQAFWIDGKLHRVDGQVVSHCGPGFPKGEWRGGWWHPNAKSKSAFETGMLDLESVEAAMIVAFGNPRRADQAGDAVLGLTRTPNRAGHAVGARAYLESGSPAD